MSGKSLVPAVSSFFPPSVRALRSPHCANHASRQFHCQENSAPERLLLGNPIEKISSCHRKGAFGWPEVGEGGVQAADARVRRERR
jgi:hypothetical protein